MVGWTEENEKQLHIEDRLRLAEKKLAEFDQVWDGEKYCFTPKPLPEPRNSCNRHSDCKAADEKARSKGYFGADHCHDDCCEDCFGN